MIKNKYTWIIVSICLIAFIVGIGAYNNTSLYWYFPHNVGIHTTNPGAELHVYQSGSNAILWVERDSGGKAQIQAQSTDVAIGNIASGDLKLIADNDTKAIITTDGYLGINTVIPLMEVDVDGYINSRKYQWIEEFDDEVAAVQFESGLHADAWVTAGTNYAAANVTYIQYQGGALQAVTAGADNDSVTVTGIPMSRINKNPIIEARFKILDITNVYIAIGLVEGSYADKAAHDDDIIVIGIDSDNGHGAGADNFIVITNDNNGGVAYADSNTVITANTFYTIRIDTTDTEQPRVWIDNTEIAAASITGTIQDTTWVRPYIMVQSLSGAADTITVDYIKMWSER